MRIDSGIRVGATAPDFTLTDTVTGQPVHLRDYAGRDVLLVFLRGTWCPYCREQMRLLSENAARLTSAGIQVIGIVCQSQVSVERYLTANPWPFPLLADAARTVARAYGIHYLFSWEGFNLARPSLFILDAGGRVTFAYVGRNMADLPIGALLEKFVGFLGDGTNVAA